MKLFKFFKSQKGFTLIELLVVIGVLGILATGLLATIDPLEQFRKGSDSNEKTSSLELVNALTRYYAVHNTFPWYAAADGGAGCNGGTPPAPTQVTGLAQGVTTTFNDCLTTLESEGELKTTFHSQNSILGHLWVVDTTPTGSTSKSVSVCFHPDSKSEQSKATTNYATANVANGPTVPLAQTCTAASGSNCFECTQ